MSRLYTNSKGFDVTYHSYSAGQDWRQCAHLYYLKRCRGLRDKEQRAAGTFGGAVEDALQYYHVHGEKAGDGVTQFKAIWASKQEEVERYKFTGKEGSWQDLYHMGAAMLTLYEARWRSFGYSSPQFQINYQLRLFPGSELHDIQQSDFVDMTALRESRRIVIDIKTAKAPLDVEHPAMLRLDPQLREYAWMTKTPDVAFLWFTKAGATFASGDVVTLLAEPEGEWTVAWVDKKAGTCALLGAEQYISYCAASDEIHGKGSKAREQELRDRTSARVVTKNEITKVQLQFVTTTIPEDAARGEAESVRRDIASIVQAGQMAAAGAEPSIAYPRKSGIRFPNNTCSFCSMRQICCGEEVTLVDSPAERMGAIEDNRAVDWLAS